MIPALPPPPAPLPPPPSQAQVAALEAQYADVGLPFPSSYPTAALLGSVIVDDVVTNADFAASAPPDLQAAELNDSPFLFLCSSPATLTVPIAVSGDHKIWKLPKLIHEAAVANLEGYK